MPQQHLDRLTPVDASFLHQEGPVSHMHVGGLTVFEGPPPTLEQFFEQIRGRLHLVPRYRHKLAHMAIDSGRPVWVDDPAFNLEYHVRHTALPAPGDWEQLRQLSARIFSQQLDRTKPLWETWLIEGLEHNRFALISKTHHSLIDGISGVDLATVLYDLSPVPQTIEHSGRPWRPNPEPGTVALITAGVRGAVRAGIEIAEGAIDAVAHPERAIAFSGIPGTVPSPLRATPGCRFAPRCSEARDVCTERRPHLSVDASGRRVDCVLYDQPELVAT